MIARLLVTAALLAPAVPAQDDPYFEDLKAAEQYAAKGKHARARAIFEEIVVDAEDFGVGNEGPSADILRAAKVGLLELGFVAGEYAEVADGIGGLDAVGQKAAGVRGLLARVKIRTGAYEEAIEILRGLVAAHPERPEYRWRLGDALAAIGQHDDARRVWSETVALSRTRGLRDPEALTWIARAHVSLGSRADLERASSLLVDAARRAPELPAPRIQLGWLQFLAYGEAAGYESGERLISRVLQEHGEIEEALVRLYRIRSTNMWLDSGKTAELLDRALGLNPRSVDALLLRGIRLLDDRRFEEGAETLDAALEVNPRDKRVLAQRAAAAHLQGDEELQAKLAAQVVALDGGSTVELDVALGDRLVALYRFADALEPYGRALEQAPDDVDVLQGLAKACVYTGAGERARALLGHAEELESGLVDPWRRNVLAIEELLASDYERVEREGFVFKLHRDDRAVLEEYLIPVHEEARAVLGRKYGHVPPAPVTVEVLHTWEDFSVRTIGFRGFSALGACFGPLITLVSPVDDGLRKLDFMWSATVWHEYAHVLTLALSKSRVPRWLTEGISVYEERERDSSWERGMDRELFDAYHNGDIPPVRLLNRLFRGPRIMFGYYQGGLIVEYLAREHGFDRIVDMLGLYGEDVAQEEIFERTFGVDTRTFDERFLAFVRDDKLRGLKLVPRYDERAVQRLFDRLAREPDDLETHVALAWAMLQRDVVVDAASHLREILARDPESADAALIHAELLRRRERFDEAVAAYERGFGAGANDFDSRIEYGRLLEARGDLDGAARQYLAAKACWPRCTDQNVAPPVLLARLYRKQDRRAEAMMELKSFCNLTARAFSPRLTLAEYENEGGNREAEAELLEGCVQIDPFMRSLHVRLADALLATGREREAARELRVALVIDPQSDREYMGEDDRPTTDSPEYREAQAATCVALAKILRGLGEHEEAQHYLERAEHEAPDSAAAGEAAELRERWRR